MAAMKTISESTMRRLPVYLRYLHQIRDTQENISASAIAAAFGLNDVQVRKDLGAVSGLGKPKTGYRVTELITQLEDCLGYREQTKAVLVGAGNLGKALLSYEGFSDYGLRIVAAFDTDTSLWGQLISGKPVMPPSDLESVCFENRIDLGIITAPAGVAQAICDRMIASGIRAIWNFAPTILRAPETVLVENENLASSLAILSKHLHHGKEREEPTV